MIQLKKTAFTVFIIFKTLSPALSQSDFFCFKQIKLFEALRIEKGFGSKERFYTFKTSISKDFVPNGKDLQNKLAQPLQFYRHDPTFYPAPEISYFFLESDSTVKIIEYSWDTRNYMNNLNDLKNQGNSQETRKKDYTNKYDSLFSYLSNKFGKPTKGTGKEKSHCPGNGDCYTERDAIWQVDIMTIQLAMTWTENAQSYGTYRVRIIISWG